MIQEPTLETKIEKTIKQIVKYTKYAKNEKCKQSKGLFQAVANTSSWNLSEYQKEHFDLVNKILLKNKMVINEQGRIEEYNPQKHELLYNN